MRRKFSGLHRVGTTDHQRAIAATDTAVAKIIRERDADLGCVTCPSRLVTDCGHFRIRQCMPTRYHPYNLAGQCGQCNRYGGGKTYEFGLAIDRRWGKGTAAFLEKLSRKIEPWTTEDLGTLREAARMGLRVYCQAYFDLRTPHRFRLT